MMKVTIYIETIPYSTKYWSNICSNIALAYSTYSLMFPQYFYTWMLLWSNVAAIHDFRFTIAFFKWWVRLSLKAILQQYLANIYQHERNINFIIIFLCWFLWWFWNIARIFVQYMNTGRMFPFSHWLLEQYCLNFPTTFENFPLRGM